MIDTRGLTPIAIGCKGGSGSRVLRDIITASPQIYMDQDTSQNSKDSKQCNAFFDVGDAAGEVRTRELDRFVQSILQQIPAGELARYRFVGWKHPRMIRHIDLLFEACPHLRFLHLIRDPAAVARGRLWRKGYKGWLQDGKKVDYDKKILRRWVVANRYAWQKYKDDPRYLLVRYEDIVLKKRDTVQQLFDWLGVSDFDLEEAVSFIKPSANALNRGDDVDLTFIRKATHELGYGYKLEQKVQADR